MLREPENPFLGLHPAAVKDQQVTNLVVWVQSLVRTQTKL